MRKWVGHGQGVYTLNEAHHVISMMDPLSAEELAPLTLLLKAQSKSTVVSVCRESFIHRNEKTPDMVLASVTKTLNIQPVEATKLLHSMSLLIRTVLYRGLSDAPSIATVFPGDFHENLKGLLSDTIARNLGINLHPPGQNGNPQYCKTKPCFFSQPFLDVSHSQGFTTSSLFSLPRLVDFDWRVDVKISSDSVARMAQPTCLVQMKVADTPQRTDQLPSVRSLNVEFSKETLETMLDGLGKIRDQLSSVAKSS